MRQLRMYGVVSWLNAPDRVSRCRRLTPLLAVFVFRSCVVVVVVAHELTRDKKKTKVRLPVTQLTTSQSDQTSSDCARFAELIPADELIARVALGDDDARSSASDGCVWELVHCRSETEGRPETVFQLACTEDARREFVRLIHAMTRRRRRRTLPTSLESSRPLVAAGRDAARHLSVQRHFRHVTRSQPAINTTERQQPIRRPRSLVGVTSQARAGLTTPAERPAAVTSAGCHRRRTRSETLQRQL